MAIIQGKLPSHIDLNINCTFKYKKSALCNIVQINVGLRLSKKLQILHYMSIQFYVCSIHRQLFGALRILVNFPLTLLNKISQDQLNSYRYLE